MRGTSAKGREVGRPGRYRRRQAERAGISPPLEEANQKAAPAARRGGLAARADLPTPPESPRIASAAPTRNPLDPSRTNRAARIRRAAPENACPAQGRSAAPDLSAVEKGSPHRVSNRGNLPPRLRVEFAGPWEMWTKIPRTEKWSGRRDLNPGPFAPQNIAVCFSEMTCIDPIPLTSIRASKFPRPDKLWQFGGNPRLDHTFSESIPPPR